MHQAIAASVMGFGSPWFVAAPAPTPAEPGPTDTADEDDLTLDATPTASPDQPPPPPTDPVPTEAPAPTPSEPPPWEAELEALRTRIDELETQRAADAEAAEASRRELRAEIDAQKAKPAPSWWQTSGDGESRPPTEAGFDRGITPDQYGVRLGGYLQVQYQWSQLSEDQLQQGGATLNRNRFAVRRGRLRATGDWKFFAFEFEVDGSTTRGLFFGIRQANLSVLYRNPDTERPPWIQLTAGLTEVPFGYEVRLGQRDLLFMERSLGSLAFFPGPVDVGLRLRGGVGPFRYDVAVMNGTPLDDRAGGPGGVDPTSKPDVAGRFGFEALPKRLAFGGGVSFLAGTGFHPGREASKNFVQWQDFNENGTIESGELVSVPGTGAVPSENFRHWAVNADLQFGIRTKLGWSSLVGEATFGTNLDRGFAVADPVLVGADIRHLQAYGAFTQDLFRWAVVGFRYDYYDPDADLLDRRRGETVPVDSAIHTMSPIVGAILPPGVARGFRGRLVFQYDAVLDNLGRDERGVPANLRNDQFTVRLQGEF